MTLLIIIVLEMAAGLYYKMTSVHQDIVYFRQSDSYKNAPWINDYDKEMFASYNSSWRSYVYWRRKPYQGKYININKQGIRYTSPSKVSEANAAITQKIFMFGGSTMWGEGVRDQYTLPSLVVKDLAAHNVRAEITNFGEVAYVNTQELIELVLQLERGHIPDIAVFYDGWNDVYSALQNGVAGLPQYEWTRDLEYNLSKHYCTLRRLFWQKSVDQFYLGKILNSLSNKLHPPKTHKKIAGLENEIMRVYLSNLKIITALGKAYGFIPVFYWQPVIYTKKHLTAYEKKYSPEELGTLYDKTYTQLRQHKAKLVDYHFYDITDLFAEDRNPVYIDYCHVNEDANQIIAERMANDLMKIIKANSRTGKSLELGMVRKRLSAPGPGSEK
jgi:lysophospholipase L1-like esterase